MNNPQLAHPKKFEVTPTTECSLCHGQFSDGTVYLTLELETWDGPNANLCGKCIGLMHAETDPASVHKGKRVKANG